MKTEIRGFFKRCGVIAYPLILIVILTILMVVMDYSANTIESFQVYATSAVLLVGVVAAWKTVTRR